MYLYPTRCAGDVLSMVLRAPTFDETHSDGAHLREFINGFEAVVNTLGEQLGEFGVVKYPQGTTGGNFTNR